MAPRTRPERVLVVDDSPEILALVTHHLAKRGYTCSTAADGKAAIELALATRPDLVVLDLTMPEVDGVEVCERLRADPRTAAVSIVMLTARALTTDLVDGLACGADDYVAKPFDPDELVARVASCLRRATQLRASSPLTGLPGNATITSRVDQLLASGEPFALVHADLDGFKAYNDHYGFVRGDTAIRYTADTICSTAVDACGEGAFVGHIGGDDFALVLGPEQVEVVADALVAAFDLNVHELYDDEDRSLSYIEVADRTGTLHRFPLLSISLGIATSRVRSFSTSAELAAVAVEMKGCAKAAPGSSWRVDRRRA